MRTVLAGYLSRAPLLLAMLAVYPAAAQTLSPQEVFRRVAPSIVVVEVKDYPSNGPAKLIASGSGVVLPNEGKSGNKIVTNCHVVDDAEDGVVGIQQGDKWGVGFLTGRDEMRDLCVIDALMFKRLPGEQVDVSNVGGLQLRPVQVSSSRSLEVGDSVYAIGAPQGLELSLSNGLVSGFREYKGSEYIQTTAPISKGSSGGGLFDAQGRLVGITTMYVKDGQALNFAVPAELIASIPEYKPGKIQSAPQKPTSEPEIAKKQGRWRLIFHAEPSNSNYFIDTKSQIVSGNSITAWIKSTSGYGAAWVVDEESVPYHEEFRRITFFCDTWEVLVSESYITNRNGAQIGWRGKNGPFTVSPTSLLDPIIDAVCSL